MVPSEESQSESQNPINQLLGSGADENFRFMATKYSRFAGRYLYSCFLFPAFIK
jgi:hypothetical protein